MTAHAFTVTIGDKTHRPAGVVVSRERIRDHLIREHGWSWVESERSAHIMLQNAVRDHRTITVGAVTVEPVEDLSGHTADEISRPDHLY